MHCYPEIREFEIELKLEADNGQEILFMYTGEVKMEAPKTPFKHNAAEEDVLGETTYENENIEAHLLEEDSFIPTEIDEALDILGISELDLEETLHQDLFNQL